MKTIIQLIIVCLVYMTMASAIQIPSGNTKSVMLQATALNVSAQQLTQASKIISGRLKIFGLESFKLTIRNDKGQIMVQLPGDTDLSELEGLFTHKGELAFYEAVYGKEIAGTLKDKKPLLTGADVESITSSRDKDSQSVLIKIKFKTESAMIWSEITRKNLNKPIALVVDDKVFYTPVVKVPMDNGLCEISGSMTQKEVDYFLALVNNDKLPLSFIIK